MAKIDIDIETIRSSATTLEAKVNELKVMRFDLYKLISQIDDTWDGPASRSYINRMSDYLTKIDVISNVLSAYSVYLRNTANDLEKLDTLWNNIDKILQGAVTGITGIKATNIKM